MFREGLPERQSLSTLCGGRAAEVKLESLLGNAFPLLDSRQSLALVFQGRLYLVTGFTGVGIGTILWASQKLARKLFS